MKSTLFLPVCLFFCINLYSQPPVVFSVSNTTVSTGDDFIIPVKTQDFDNISSFSFSLRWDETLVDFDTIISFNADLALNNSNFNMSPLVTNSGNLAISWFDISGIGKSLADNSTLFEIRFRALSNPGTTMLEFTDDLAPIIAENLQGVLPVSTTPGTITVQIVNSTNETNDWIDMSISPNPTREDVLLKYSFINPSPVIAEAFDLNGRLLWRQERDIDLVGELKFDTSMLPSGNYIIRLTSEKGSVAKLLEVIH